MSGGAGRQAASSRLAGWVALRGHIEFAHRLLWRIGGPDLIGLEVVRLAETWLCSFDH